MLTWNEEYSVHVPRLDRQHRRILKTFGELRDLGHSASPQRRLDRIFRRLHRHIEEHFRDEEAMLLAAGYPGLEEQKAEHRAFIDEVCSHHREFLKNRPVVAINLFNYLWDWFVHHVLSVDKKYEPVLARRSGGNLPGRTAPPAE